MFLRSAAPAPSPSVKQQANGHTSSKLVPDKGGGKSLGSSSSSSNNSGNQSHDTPVLGRMAASHVHVGVKVWVADASTLWRVGEVQSVDAAQQTAQVYASDSPNEAPLTLPLDQLYTFDASHIVDHEDIAQMNSIHEAPLLSVLRQRFEQDKIYTFTADILLSVNPYKTIPLLYDVTGFMAAHGTSKQQSPQDSSPGGALALSASPAVGTPQPPHLFTIAGRAYAGMKGTDPGTGAPQSIIVSGESGAGKTEACKYVMKYLAKASQHSTQPASCGGTAAATDGSTRVHDKIEQCVVLSSLILESFGNAKTSRNDNSSRFGKYIQIHYNAEGRMAGVSIRHFLLEKTRLVLPQAQERNYHIFYQLLRGLSPSQALKPNDAAPNDSVTPLLLSDDVWRYAFLTRGGCVDVANVDDAAEFDQLCTCMTQLGMDADHFQRPLFELLAAILHLGNVAFETANGVGASGNNASGNNDEEECVPCFPEKDHGVDLELVSRLLGVNAVDFAKKMVTQTTITGRGSILEMPLAPAQAKNALDAFCKYLYGELFHHLVARINSYAKEQTASTGLSNGGAHSRGNPAMDLSSPFIGILDIFGFEIMQRNSLEQLCINFTNEMLQQQFNKHVFVLEQQRYAAEGISFASVEFRDNQACLDLIQKPPQGLLPLLEEQMLLKRKTTDQQLLTIYHKTHLERSAAHYAKPRFASDEFIIHHYAGDVTYDVNAFITKNTDNLHDDLLDLLRQSSHPLLREMFPKISAAPVAASVRPSGKGKTALTGTSTVTSRFRLQLAELMDVLGQTSPHYIKCIKPNTLKFPGGFSAPLVRDQLVYSGVLEVVRIRQEGFPVRKRYDDFLRRFWPLAGTNSIRASDGPTNKPQEVRGAVESIARTWLHVDENPAAPSGKQLFAMGRSEVFLRYGQMEKLEAHVASLRHSRAVLLQSSIRGKLARSRYTKLQRAALVLQADWRRTVASCRYKAQKSGAIRIQAKLRGRICRVRYQAQYKAAGIMVRIVRRFLSRVRFARWKRHHRASCVLQRNTRAFLARTASERQKRMEARAILTLQSWHRMMVCHIKYQKTRTAAISIQSRQRARYLRAHYLERRTACIAMAAFMRQVLQRRQFRRLKHCVVRLQAMSRQRRLSKEFVALRGAVCAIQRQYRQKLAHRELVRRRNAVPVLQRAARRWRQQARSRLRRRAARCVVRAVTPWLRRREFRRLRRAVRVLQRVWVRRYRTVRWQRQLAALFRSSGNVVYSDDDGPVQETTTAGKSAQRRNAGGGSLARMEDSDRRMQALRTDPYLYFSLRPRAFGYNTLFHHAAACGDLQVVKFMLASTCEDLEQARIHQDRHQHSYMQRSLDGYDEGDEDDTDDEENEEQARENERIARECRDQHQRTLLGMTNGRGRTAFHRACAQGQYETARFLLQLQVGLVAPDGSTSTQLDEENVDTSHIQSDAFNANQDETSSSLNSNVIYAGFLRKRRETSRWMKRYVVLAMDKDKKAPYLAYYANDKPATLAQPSAKRVDLRSAIFKKSESGGGNGTHASEHGANTPFAFELHSPHLVEGRNREGRLYFAADSELESQRWLAHLRDTLPSTSITAHVFALHRASKDGAVELVNFEQRRAVCMSSTARGKNSVEEEDDGETALHLVAGAATIHRHHTQHQRRRASTELPSENGGSVTPGVLQLGPAVPSASVISVASVVTVDTERSASVATASFRRAYQPSGTPSSDDPTKSLMATPPPIEVVQSEAEAALLRTALWLIECGADVNARTAKGDTPLRRALRARNLVLATHLVDRGALAYGLSSSDTARVQSIKAALAPLAIASIGSSSSSGTSALDPSKNSSSRQRSSSLVSTARSFSSTIRKKSVIALSVAGSSSSSSMTSSSVSLSSSSDVKHLRPDVAPLLFLQKQPGRTRHSSYMSVYVESMALADPRSLPRPRLLISVLDIHKNPIEMTQQVVTQPAVLKGSLLWAVTWHMQTPLENLPQGTCVVLQLAISPRPEHGASSFPSSSSSSSTPSSEPLPAVISPSIISGPSTSTTAITASHASSASNVSVMSLTSNASAISLASIASSACTVSPRGTSIRTKEKEKTKTRPRAGANDFEPVCWTYLRVDQRTATCMPLSTEMYAYPLDLSLKRLTRVDAFVSGDIFISHNA